MNVNKCIHIVSHIVALPCVNSKMMVLMLKIYHISCDIMIENMALFEIKCFACKMQ